MEFVLNDKYSNKSLNPLGEVGYMDYTMPFGTVKNQRFINIIHLAWLKTKDL